MASAEIELMSDQARERLPLKRILEQNGSGPRGPGESWKSFRCPFCNQAKKAGVVEKEKQDLFKCFYVPCASGNEALNEITLLAKLRGVSNKDAWKQWVMEAGVWKEERTAPSVLPGSSRRKRKDPLAEVGVTSPESKKNFDAEVREPTDVEAPAPPPELSSSVSRDEGNSAAPQQSSSNSASEMAETLSSAPRSAPENAALTPGEAGTAIAAPHSETEAAPSSGGGKIVAGVFVGQSGERGNTGDILPASSLFGGPRGGGPGGPGGGGPGGPQMPGGSDEVQALLALRDFYSRIALHPEDEQRLLEQRGFTPEFSRRMGFRSSRPENLAVLRELGRVYPERVLVLAGLWRKVADLASAVWAKPSGKYYGWGRVERKVKEEEEDAGVADDLRDSAADRGVVEADEEEEVTYEETFPILIPYWNSQGELTHLRPHKDYVKGRGVHLYVARQAGCGDGRCEVAVICEAEFKAAALAAVFTNGELMAASIPGISTAKKESLKKEILYWLAAIGAKQVIVAFDNEEKGDPALASYKEDPRKRYDTEVWARYLAGWLVKEDFRSTVAWLRNEWRDEKGKADWDGVLARKLKEERKKEEDIEGVWRRAQAGIRRDFWKVLESGVKPDESVALFDSQRERIIKNKLVRLRYVPKLPYGGKKEFKVAETCWRLYRQRDFDYGPRARYLGDAFKGVLNHYYRRMPLKMGEKDRKMFEQRKRDAEDEANRTGNWDAFTFYDELLKGVPEAVANFRMDCRFVLVKGNLGEDRDRMVVLRNHLGRSKLVALDPKSFTAPRDFKLWTTRVGPFTWQTGEKELEMLREDTDNLSAHLEVFELTWYGWHERPKLWVAADCAITPEGKMLVPDADGVIWWADSGYMMSQHDAEGEEFVQPAPKWRPGEGVRVKEDGYSFELKRGEDDMEAVTALFQEFSSRIYDTLGGRDGYLSIGSMLAFGVAPEFYNQENWFSGAWLHGERGGGKTTLARVLMNVWGFRMDNGSNLQTGSKVGMQLLAQQFCNLPIWYEEYKNGDDKVKIEFIKSLYNRELAAKKEFGNARRKIRTNAIVTGEHTAIDSATMQRFPHINVAREKRRAEHKDWFMENSLFFFSFGRVILRNRGRYRDLFWKAYEQWRMNPALAGSDDRSRDVYGVGYAGYVAMCQMLDELSGVEARNLPEVMRCYRGKEMEAFKHEMVAATMRAVRDVKESVNINQFWQTLLTAWKSGVFGYGEPARKYFKAVKSVAAGGHPPGAPNQAPGFSPEMFSLKPWESYVLYIDHNAVMSELQEHLRKQGQTLPIAPRDLREQLSKEPYWVPSRSGDGHRQRMGSGRAPSRVWCIDLDKARELGYQPVSDEELIASREGVGSSEWVDPRLGELYQIVFSVERTEDPMGL